MPQIDDIVPVSALNRLMKPIYPLLWILKFYSFFVNVSNHVKFISNLIL